jgi:hypothetical protein
MRTKRFLRVVRSILCLMALSGVASAGSTVPLENSYPTTERLHLNSPLKSASPGCAHILSINTPLSQKDPQRKIFMFDPDEGYRPDCRRCGPKHVLSYLRQMERVSKKFKRRDMVWYYQEAWEFVSRRIYGALPPRKQDMLGTFYQPANPAVPENFRPPVKQQPLRRIVQLNDHPHGLNTLKWEMLECGHELMCAPGYSVPAKSRRCLYCAFAAAEKTAAKKRPASAPSNDVPIAKAKAVGA